MRWAEKVACVGNWSAAYRKLVGKTEGMRTLKAKA